MLRFSSQSTWGPLPFSRLHVEVWGFNFLVSFHMSNEKRMVGLGSCFLFLFFFSPQFPGLCMWWSRSRQIPDSTDSRRHWSLRVDRPVTSLQMCQKASEDLGENLQVSKERADRLSFKATCHSQTEASPVWLTQRQCAVTSPLLRPHYLVESATVEEEQPRGTMKYLVERLRQQEVSVQGS